MAPPQVSATSDFGKLLPEAATTVTLELTRSTEDDAYDEQEPPEEEPPPAIAPIASGTGASLAPATVTSATMAKVAAATKAATATAASPSAGEADEQDEAPPEEIFEVTLTRRAKQESLGLGVGFDDNGAAALPLSISARTPSCCLRVLTTAPPISPQVRRCSSLSAPARPPPSAASSR